MSSKASPDCTSKFPVETRAEPSTGCSRCPFCPQGSHTRLPAPGGTPCCSGVKAFISLPLALCSCLSLRPTALPPHSTSWNLTHPLDTTQMLPPSQWPVWPPSWTELLLPVRLSILTTLLLEWKTVRPYNTVIFHVSTLLARIRPYFQPIVGTQLINPELGQHCISSVSRTHLAWMLNICLELNWTAAFIDQRVQWLCQRGGSLMLCHPLYSLLKMCFCFIGISCKPQEAIPARVSGSTFCLSSSTLHQGQSFHPYVTVYFYPYYKQD